MTKKLFPYLAAMAVAMASNPYYDTGYSSRTRTRKMTDEEKRARGRKLCPLDMSEREFTIHGEKIMAHDRKTALKIYALRHPETKKKRR